MSRIAAVAVRSARRLINRARKARFRRGRDAASLVAVKPHAADANMDFAFFAIIGTWNESDIIEATVRNALCQGAERVLLVDNGSSDQTTELARRSGAEIARLFHTDGYDEERRLREMNDVVAEYSARASARRVWWLWLDADEFPHGPSGLTVRDYLATLDERCRVVGATFYNHFPRERPAYVPGFHPLDFQPLCERFDQPTRPTCGLSHWKHPLIRVDRHRRNLTMLPGFHAVSASGWACQRLLAEPIEGIITHHFQYRESTVTRSRLRSLAGGGRFSRNAANEARGNVGIGKRLASIDAVYNGDWHRVDNLRLDGTRGVTPIPWSETPDFHPGQPTRWYE